jgi:hypothetical protein
MSSEVEDAYPWLAERAETSSSGNAANGAESGTGTRPDNAMELVVTDGAEASVVADSTPSMNDSGREPAVPFLQSLVDAMRKIADQTRDDAVARLRASVAERAAAIRAETEQRAAELHEVADADLAGVASWEQGEIQRIRDEAAAKVSARNATLDAQLAANTAAGEGALTAVEARVDAFEAEMTSFFAQLNEIHDPAALGSALKRIPTAPSLTDTVAPPAGDTAPSPAAAVVPEPVVAAAPDAFADSQAAAAPASEVAAPAAASAAPAQETHGQVDPDGEATSPASVAVATAPAPVADAAEGPAAAEEPVAEEEPAAEPAAATAAPAAAPVEETGEEATTQVLVTGLTSFGAITSFKQSLEHVAGIHRVSLGLGTSGEFIFTAVHRAGFDLAGAIRTFEESALFASSDGHLRVTVGSKA